MCSISGYGTTGAYADMKAYDALIQAETGLCSVTGAPGQPSKVGASICDISTGLSAYGEILKALYARHGSGVGTHVELSLFEVLSEWMAVPLAILEYTGKMLTGTGMDHAQLAPYGAYAAKDGPIFVVIQNNREWVQLCRDGLERPEMADDPRYRSNVLRVENRDALRADMEAVFARYTQAELALKLNRAGIACGSINDIGGLQKHPALKRKEIEAGGHTVSLIRRTGDVLSHAAVPALDQQGAALRAEFASR
jgi:itaconate CoA-transferase